MKRSFVVLLFAMSCASTKLRSLNPQNTFVTALEPINRHLKPRHQYWIRLRKHNTANSVLIANAAVWIIAKHNIYTSSPLQLSAIPIKFDLERNISNEDRTERSNNVTMFSPVPSESYPIKYIATPHTNTPTAECVNALFSLDIRLL